MLYLFMSYKCFGNSFILSKLKVVLVNDKMGYCYLIDNIGLLFCYSLINIIE